MESAGRVVDLNLDSGSGAVRSVLPRRPNDSSVRDYAREKGVGESAAVATGLEEKALEFRKAREIYIPATK